MTSAFGISELLDVIAQVCPGRVPQIDDGAKSLHDYGLDSLDLSGIWLELEKRYGLPPSEAVEAEQTTPDAIVTYIRARATERNLR